MRARKISSKDKDVLVLIPYIDEEDIWNTGGDTNE